MKNRQNNDSDLEIDVREDLEEDYNLEDSQESSEEINDESENIDQVDNETKEDSESEESEELEEELSIEIDGESPPQIEESKQAAPAWVRELRKQNRELKRQNREFQDKLNGSTGLINESIELGKKPTLEACDYDSDKFEGELAEWFERKRKVDEHQSSVRRQQEESQKRWEQELKQYNESKSKIKISDFEDAEESVSDKLSAVQQAIIISGVQNPAYVIYALGKNPKKLNEMANITDPIKFACSVSRLETQLKIKTTKKAPAPEKSISGSASGVGSNATLARLEAEAAKTGDRTKVLQYHRKIRESKK